MSRSLASSRTELWLSPISVWETLVLIEKGRVSVPRDAMTWVNNALAASALSEAPLTLDIVRESWRVDLPYPDPADRFLVATARTLDLTLATADRRILAQKPCRLMSNS